MHYKQVHTVVTGKGFTDIEDITFLVSFEDVRDASMLQACIAVSDYSSCTTFFLTP